MSENEGEMFFLDNWIFASDVQSVDKRSEPEHLANLTSQLISPLRPHAVNPLVESLLRFRARSALLKRDFKCPEGTNDCSSIGAPNSCCSTDATCISIEDTGFGPVGCCSSGQSCSGEISCDTDGGYTSCPNSPNGGCCLPGYSCQDVGCKCLWATLGEAVIVRRRGRHIHYIRATLDLYDIELDIIDRRHRCSHHGFSHVYNIIVQNLYLWILYLSCKPRRWLLSIRPRMRNRR
jgi:hypothetical protein